MRLHRGIAARLANNGLQAVLSVLSIGTLIAIGYGQLLGRDITVLPLSFWFVFALYFLPWLAGVTAWARVDEAGIRWRYWYRQGYIWQQISQVELTERRLAGAPALLNRATTIAVHGRAERDFEEYIRPAERAGPGLRRFADELSAQARRNGVQVAIESSRWERT